MYQMGVNEAFELLQPMMKEKSIEAFTHRTETDFAIELEDYAR